MLIDALGSTWQIIHSRGEVPPAWDSLWSRCLAGSGRRAATHVIDLADLRASRLPPSAEGEVWSTEAGSYAFVSHLNLEAIRRIGGRHLMLHAAGVADPVTGKVVVLTAASGTGKTTACLRLCTETFAYVTDETVVVEDDGSVWPFEKPLSVVVPGDASKRQHGPEELGLISPPSDLTVGALVVLDRDPAATAPSTTLMEPMEGLLALIGQSSALPVMEDPLARLHALATRAGGIWRLRYAEIDQATELLTGLLDRSGEWPSATHLPPRAVAMRDYSVVPAPTEGPVRTWPSEQRFARGRYSDALALEEEVLVLAGASPCRLTGLGATVWRSCDLERTRADLRARVIELHGPHEQADALIDSTLTTLVRAGLMEPVA